jgi:predicted TIM-barrel fold metal-dependent hydrolase
MSTAALLAPIKALPPLFDVNAAIGDWPFRRVPCNTPERLIERMDRLGIQRAAVSRLENVFYKDCLVGNRELHQLIAAHSDRFLPLFTINPAFPGWEADLDICQRELGLVHGAAGIRLYPTYHQFALDGEPAARLLARAVVLDVPVVLSARLEDERTHHWLCRVPALTPDSVAAVIAAFPAVRWVVCGLRAPQVRAVWRTLQSRPDSAGLQIVFDLSLVQGPIDECQLLTDAVGAERIAFGTNLPLTVPESATLALAYSDLPPATIAQIGAGNATRHFGLTP